MARSEQHGPQWPKDVESDACFVVSTAKAQFNFVADSKESARFIILCTCNAVKPRCENICLRHMWKLPHVNCCKFGATGDFINEWTFNY